MSLGLEDGTVRLVTYDPTWPSLFVSEAARIRAALGDSLPLHLQHMGSTAIPGLVAKPILDILAGVPSGADLAPYINALVQLGYTHRGESGIPGRQFFRRGVPRSHHLHLSVHNGAFWHEQLAFRDALRAQPSVRNEYADVKVKLAERFPRNREAYIEGKSDFIRAVVSTHIKHSD